MAKQFIKWPPPGSHEAVKEGCTCPEIDNAYGKGVPSASGDAANYWVSMDCPLHKKTTQEE